MHCFECTALVESPWMTTGWRLLCMMFQKPPVPLYLPVATSISLVKNIRKDIAGSYKEVHEDKAQGQ